jgi:hypothetical protein
MMPATPLLSSSPPLKKQRHSIFLDLMQPAPYKGPRITMDRLESHMEGRMVPLYTAPKPELFGSLFDTFVGMSDRAVRELMRHREETRAGYEEVPKEAHIDAANAGRARFTRGLIAKMANGQQAHKTYTVEASTSGPQQRFSMSCLVDCCEPNQWPGQPLNKLHIAVLWMPVPPSNRAEITWEEASSLIRSMGVGGLFHVLERVSFLYSIREHNTVSRTLMGFDNPWMPAEDRHPDHNYGHNLSGM